MPAPVFVRHHSARRVTPMLLVSTLTLLLAGVASPAYAAGTGTVATTDLELTTALANTDTTRVTLGSDITVTEATLPVASTTVVLNLNGHTLTAQSVDLHPGVSLTVESSDLAQAGVLTAFGDGIFNLGVPAISTHAATFIVDSGTVNASTANYNYAAAIGGDGRSGGSQADGGTVVISGGTVNATSNGNGSAIGSGFSGVTVGHNFGSITINDGTVIARNTEAYGAGLGGSVGTHGGTLLIRGGDVTASVAGFGSAAIGTGSYGRDVGNAATATVTIEGGTVDATVGAQAYSGAAIGGGYLSPGVNVTIGAGADVTVSSQSVTTPESASASVIGAGVDGAAADGTGFGSLNVAGTLRIAAGSLIVPADAVASIAPTGVITGAGSLSGAGTITNDGSIRNTSVADSSDGADGLNITNHNYAVGFAPNDTETVPAAPATVQEVRVYATSFAEGNRTAPDIARTFCTFQNWNSSADGSGSVFGLASVVVADSTHFAQWTTGELALSSTADAVIAGGASTFTVQGTDSAGVDLGDVTAQTTFTTDDPTDVIDGSAITFATAGSHTVTAHFRAATAVSVVEVAAGPLASLTVVPSTDTVAAGDSLSFTLTGFDGSGNPLGDMTAQATFSSDTDGDSVTGNSIRFSKNGEHTVTGQIGAVTAIAVVNANPGPLARIETTASAASVSAGSSVSFTTEGFDAEGNSRGDTTGTTVLSVDGPGVVDGNAVTFTTAGPRTVTATVTSTGDDVTTTTQLAVSPGAISALTLTSSAQSVTAGDSMTFAAEGFDAYGNSLGDQTSRATLTTDDTRDAITGNSVRFSAAGTRTVTAAVAPWMPAGRSAPITTETTITVRAGVLASLVVTPTTGVAVAGSTVTFTVEGFDGEGNSLGDQTSAAVITTGEDADPVTDAAVTWLSAGPHTITVTVDGIRTSTLITVVADVTAPGAITLRLSGTSVALGGSATATITAVDTYGNDLGDVTDQITLSSTQTTDVIVGRTVTFRTAGPRIVTAALGALTSGVTVDVVAPTAGPTEGPTTGPADGPATGPAAGPSAGPTRAVAAAVAPVTAGLAHTGALVVPILIVGVSVVFLGIVLLVLMAYRRRTLE